MNLKHKLLAALRTKSKRSSTERWSGLLSSLSTLPLLDLTREIAAKNQELIELYRKRDEHLAQVGPPWQIDTLGNRHGPDYYELRLERAIAQMRQQLSDLELQQRVLNQRLHEAREEMKNVRVFVLKERTECRPVYYKFDPRYLRCESTRDT